MVSWPPSARSSYGVAPVPERTTRASAARRAVSGLLGVAAVGLVGYAVVAGSSATTADDGTVAGQQQAAQLSTQLPEPRLAPAEWERPGTPRRVRIPRLDVDAWVLPVKAQGDTLIPPSDPAELGWWAEGVRPGEPGRALVAGHTVHTGGGALDDLETLRRGDRVVVQGNGATSRWVVSSVEVLGKGVIARRAEQVFRQDGPARLVLMTCEDWDGRAYLSNVVVVARPQ